MTFKLLIDEQGWLPGIYLHGLRHFDEETRDMLVRECPQFFVWAEDVPPELYPLTLGNTVFMGLQDYPDIYGNVAGLDQSVPDTFGRWALAVAEYGVRFPGTQYKIRASPQIKAIIDRVTGSEPTLPTDWRSYVLVRGTEIDGQEWVWWGDNVRTISCSQFAPKEANRWVPPNTNKYVKEEYGWRLRDTQHRNRKCDYEHWQT